LSNSPRHGSILKTSERTCPACSTPLPLEAQFCMHCGVATPTDPGVPQRMATTGAFEVKKVTEALAGRYKVEKVIGEGGMATVYLATDLKHKRKVAVKVMRPELAATLGAERFLREVEIAGQLSHPHILPMYDSGESDGLLYYVMPYVPGETLRERLQREGALPADDALRLAREVAEALAYAHRQGIIHRDIKPANILLSEGHALVADFGIARAVGEGGGEQLTRTGIAVGTPQYMAPEQATGDKEVDGRADVYATGAMLYEMLAGEPPFTGPSARVILTRSLTEAPRALTGARQGLPAAVDAVVQKSLAKNPADRYATGAALVTALDGLRQVGMSSGTTPAVTAPATEVLPASSKAASAVIDALPKRWFSARNFAMAGAAALVVWAVTATVMAGRAGGGGGGGGGGMAGNRIAVLPFRNQGASSDEYFADGIADEVRGKLSGISGLKVIASSSASQYKGTTKPPQEIASELGADYLLLGTVRWANGADGKRRVQVVPELIEAGSGDVRWQQSFDTDITDVFEVQSQIATRVAGALGVALGGSEQEQVTKRPTGNVEAYQLYLKGRAIQGADPASLRESAGYLEQAVALDSTFGDAWAALTISLSRLYSNGFASSTTAQRAKEALERTVALDPNAARTHLAAARYNGLISRNRELARGEMDLALRAAPGDAEVLSAAGLGDMGDGDLGSALAKLERAREIDPRSYITLYSLSQVYAYLNRPADAEATASAALLVRPGDLNAIQWVAIGRVAQGRLDEARVGIRTAIDGGTPAPAIAAHFAGFQETSWILDERERDLVFRLTPTAFDNDRAFWGQSLSIAYWQKGDAAKARAYADSALAPSRSQAEGSPNDAQLQVLYGVMLALAGKGAEARLALSKSIALSIAGTTQHYYILLNAARIETILGNKERAIEYIEEIRKGGGYLAPRYLALDPTFASLEGNPRFEKLLK
jgi:serine/threonine-protein kinase